LSGKGQGSYSSALRRRGTSARDPECEIQRKRIFAITPRRGRGKEITIYKSRKPAGPIKGGAEKAFCEKKPRHVSDFYSFLATRKDHPQQREGDIMAKKKSQRGVAEQKGPCSSKRKKKCVERVIVLANKKKGNNNKRGEIAHR